MLYYGESPSSKIDAMTKAGKTLAQELNAIALMWTGQKVPPRPNVKNEDFTPIDVKLNDIYEVISGFRSEAGTDISNLSKQVTLFRTEFDDYVDKSSFRLDRLENYNLTTNQIESFNNKQKE